jgi:hypothetical protein
MQTSSGDRLSNLCCLLIVLACVSAIPLYIWHMRQPADPQSRTEFERMFRVAIAPEATVRGLIPSAADRLAKNFYLGQIDLFLNRSMSKIFWLTQELGKVRRVKEEILNAKPLSMAEHLSFKATIGEIEKEIPKLNLDIAGEKREWQRAVSVANACNFEIPDNFQSAYNDFERRENQKKGQAASEKSGPGKSGS